MAVPGDFGCFCIVVPAFQQSKTILHLDLVAETVGCWTFSPFAVAAGCGAATAMVWVSLKWTEIRTAARASSTSAISYSQSQDGHLCFGIVVVQERVCGSWEFTFGRETLHVVKARWRAVYCLSWTTKLDFLSLRFPCFLCRLIFTFLS